MQNLLFQDVKVIDSRSSHNGKKVDLRITNGQISAIGKPGTLIAPKGGLKVEGGCISPGWIDMRVHLTDPGYEWKDDLDSLSKAALRGGFTGILCLPNTQPVLDSRDFIESLKLRSLQLPVHFLPSGALTLGTHGKDLAELYDMHRSGAVAFTDGTHPIMETGLLLRGLQYVKPFEGLLINSPLDLSVAGDAQVGEGPNATRLGMKGIPAIAEEMMIARDLRVLDYFPGRLHLGPITTAGGASLLRKANENKAGEGKVSVTNKASITAETSVAWFCLSDESLIEFDTHKKVFPPLRTESDRLAIIAALADNTIQVISSSHQAQALEDKAVDFADAAFGMIGLETCFALSHSELVSKQKALSLADLIDKIAVNPRKILRLNAATIEEGSAAEISHFDPKLKWTFSAADIASKSRNTPFLGTELVGKALGTYCKGGYLRG